MSDTLTIYKNTRKRFNTDFIASGTGAGHSIPATFYYTNGNILTWSDGTAYHGWYLAMLATEYHLIKSGKIDFGQTLEQVTEELYNALLTLQRLIDTAGKSFLFNSAEYPGFFIRDDVPPELKESLPNKPEVNSDFIASFLEPRNKEESQDQVCHLIMGLAMVKKLLPGVTFNGMDFVKTVQNHTTNIIQWMADGASNGEGNWSIVNPGLKKKVERGGDAQYTSFLLTKAFEFITDGKVKIASKPWGEDIWLSMGRDIIKLLEFNADNLHMAMAAGASGNAWGDNTQKQLSRMAKEEKWYIYPLINAILFDIPHDRSEVMTALEKSNIMLNITPPPPGGPGMDVLQGPLLPQTLKPQMKTGWFSEHRFLRTIAAQEGCDKKTGEINMAKIVAKTVFSGLDFMLLHNAYSIVSQSTFMQNSGVFAAWTSGIRKREKLSWFQMLLNLLF